jgi:hypothetical protein
MEQPKPQLTRLTRRRVRRVKAPRYPRSLTFAPPPLKGQSGFDFALQPEMDEEDRSDSRCRKDSGKHLIVRSLHSGDSSATFILGRVPTLDR